MNETPVCIEETCIHCRNIAECQDAIRYIQATHKRRTSGEITHDELVSLNKTRFGGSSTRNGNVYTVRRHWREIVSGNVVWFKSVVKDITESIPEKRAAERAKVLKSDHGEEYATILEELAKNHWYSPHIDDQGRLAFRTDIQYAGYLKAETQTQGTDPDFPHEADDPEPEMDELTREELTFG